MDGSSFGQVQIVKIRLENIIEHGPNYLYAIKSKLDPTKTIWTVYHSFGPIAEQGISQ